MSRSAVDAATLVFVSYAVEDRATAERVVGALTLLGWQVWWDRELLPGKTFDERIADRLARAGAVVVLWSRHSVESEWVREEASDAKRRDILVPAFIEHVDPPFGFKLRHAVDLTSWDGASSAPEFASLALAISALIAPAARGVSSTSPAAQGEDASATARRRVTPAWLIFAILMILGAASGLWYWDAYYRVQLEHFANVTKRNGLPEGIGRLDASTVARRNVSLALIRHGRQNPVDEVRLVNASGNTPPAGTYATPFSFSNLNPLKSNAYDVGNPLGDEIFVVTRVTFTRDAAGRVLEQSGLSAGGRAVYTLHYGSPETGEYKRHGFASPIRESGIVYLRFARVQKGPNTGLDEQVGYLDASQQPQPDESGEYGNRFVLDDRGLIRERFALGPRLEDRPNNYGLLKDVQTHDQAGNVIETANLDRMGAPVLDRLGTAGLRLQYDSVGNISRSTFHDRSGAPVTVADMGAAGWARTYDNRGRITSQILFGPDGQPVTGPNGVAKHTFEWLTPTRSLMRFFGPTDRPLPMAGRAFEIISTWDTRGLLVESTYRNTRGEPTRVDNGCSTAVLARDSVGNIAEFRCLNEERSPTISTDGYSIAREVFDERGNPVTTRYFDRADKPGLQGASYVTVRQEYTAAGKVARVAFFDAADTPRKVRAGHASAARSYDGAGNLVREAYFDEEGHSTLVVSGYAAYTSEYDKRNREIRTLFLGTDGRPVLTDDGYAVVQSERDERGFVQGETYLDVSGRPVKSVDGYAGARITRNERGQPLEITYHDERGRPVVSADPGSAKRRFTYDSLGKMIERSDFDASGKPMMNAYGYSTMRYSYDEHGRETGRQVLDVAGRALTFKVGIDKVTKGSVAADAGFRAGDVILAYDGEAVTTRFDFTNRLELFKGDRRREVRIERGTEIVGLDVPPGRIAGLTLEERVHP